MNAPRPEWVGPCDCDLSRLPDANDESGQWSGECKMNDHEACDGTTPGWPCECLCHQPTEPARPKRWNEDDDPEQWRQREAFVRKRALNHKPSEPSEPVSNRYKLPTKPSDPS